MACRKLCKVSIECGLQVDKPVVILGDRAIIPELGYVRRGDLDALEVGQWSGTIRISVCIPAVRRRYVVIAFVVSAV